MDRSKMELAEDEEGEVEFLELESFPREMRR